MTTERTTTETRTRPVIGAFEDRGRAEQALGDLQQAGFREDEIGWAMRNEEAPEGSHDVSDEVAKDASAGAVTGGVLGGLGAAAAMALIPGIGPFLAGGALGTVLITAGASAAAGGLLGGLIGLGAGEDEAKFYDEEFRAGRPVMTVNAGDRENEAREVFRRHGYDWESRQGGSTGTGGGTATMGGERTTTTSSTIVVEPNESGTDRPLSGGGTTEYERTTTRTDRS